MKKKISTLAFCLAATVAGANAQTWFTPEVVQKADSLLGLMTVEEKLDFVSGVDGMYTKNIDRLGIRRVKMSDGPQGLGTHGLSTAYPATVMLTATWNPEMAYRYGQSLGSDCRARNVDILLGPAVNIYRSPLCGRNFEYMGEDPYLASKTSTEYIKGVQSQGVMATVKHFFANNSDYDRHRISNDMSRRAMNEIYFPAFKAAVEDAQVGAVMTSYNLVDGVWTTESPWLLKGILRDKWGFKGLVMSDWGAAHYCVPTVAGGLDLEMPDGKRMSVEDLKYYLNAGTISMDMIDEKVRNILRASIAFDNLSKTIPAPTTVLDDPASDVTALDVAREGLVLLKNDKNILPLNPKKYKKITLVGKNVRGYVRGGGSGNVTPFHFVDNASGIEQIASKNGVVVECVDVLDFMPKIAYTSPDLSETGFVAHYFTNRDLAGTPNLMKKEGRIEHNWGNEEPLVGFPKRNYSVRWTAVLNSPEGGEYDFTVGGDDGFRLIIDGDTLVNSWHDGASRSKSAVYKLEKGKNHNLVMEYYQNGGSASANLTWMKLGDDGVDGLLEELGKTDLVVACIGHDSNSEGEGSDRTFALPNVDRQLMRRLAHCKKPVVAVVNAGGNVDMNEWASTPQALLWAWYGGQNAGTAVGEVLFGEVNPSGKLPMTFEMKAEDNPSFAYYHDEDGDKHVFYGEDIFTGYRGYDKNGVTPRYPFGYGLSYTSFKISDMEVEKAPDGQYSVKFRVANTGKRDGAEVVQLYVGKDTSAQVAERPVKELRGFEKVYLKPGESKTVSLPIPASAFEYFSEAKDAFVHDSGLYNVMLGVSSRDIKFITKIDVK